MDDSNVKILHMKGLLSMEEIVSVFHCHFGRDFLHTLLQSHSSLFGPNGNIAIFAIFVHKLEFSSICEFMQI